MDVSFTDRRTGIPAKRVRELVRATLDAERVGSALVSVAFVGVSRMSRLNRDFLSHRGSTDVISFGFTQQGRSPVIGDIYICRTIAERNARRLRLPLQEELARLVVHGTLHILGYDHPEGETRNSSVMWRKQERILESAD